MNFLFRAGPGRGPMPPRHAQISQRAARRDALVAACRDLKPTYQEYARALTHAHKPTYEEYARDMLAKVCLESLQVGLTISDMALLPQDPSCHARAHPPPGLAPRCRGQPDESQL
jgi:hypothetical protein